MEKRKLKPKNSPPLRIFARSPRKVNELIASAFAVTYTAVISSVSREIPYNRNGNNRTRYAAGRGRPALPTATPRISCVHPSRLCHCEERNARRGNLPEGKTDESYTNKIRLPQGISPLRSGFTLASVEMTLKSDLATFLNIVSKKRIRIANFATVANIPTYLFLKRSLNFFTRRLSLFAPETTLKSSFLIAMAG